MKIEKINDNQIRCTLTRDDLAERELKLSELAYGSEKAKSLFHDMMQQASHEFGFEADDTPLMIEAIPASADSIVLVITKVQDPDELDTRFSKFSPSPQGAAGKAANPLSEQLKKLESTDQMLDLLKHVKDAVSDIPEPEEPAPEPEEPPVSIRFFSFDSLDSAIQAAELLKGIYDGNNTLYKDTMEDIYVLALTRSDLSVDDFNRVCNMLSEYGSNEPGNSASLAYFEEHCDIIVAKTAMQTLSSL